MLALDLIVSIISFGDNGANDEVPGLTIDSGDVIYSGMSIIIPMITEKLLLVSIFKLKYIYKKKIFFILVILNLIFFFFFINSKQIYVLNILKLLVI